VAISELCHFSQKQRLGRPHPLCTLLNEPLVGLAAHLEIILSITLTLFGDSTPGRALGSVFLLQFVQIVKQVEEIFEPLLSSLIQEPELM
jgi:hypothetical protein